MASTVEPPNLDAVLDGLKNFQRDTVDYAFRRLYLDPEITHRFLIADEVGLGKTIVAKGLIAKAVNHLWDRVGRIDVIYICSNADIARQNLSRLSIPQLRAFNFPSRITMLPITVSKLKESKVNFISFTPGTSLDLRSRSGIISERVLLYWLLEQPWHLDRLPGALDVLQDQAKKNFLWQVRNFPAKHEIDKELASKFVDAASSAGLGDEFAQACHNYIQAQRTSTIDASIRRAGSRIIGRLRSVLAQTCIEAIEPDLIILDEFQRFKHLLSETDEASQLAQSLFNYADEHSRARVLLLSATPYKMYTLEHESAVSPSVTGESDNHYEDFLRTFEFLAPQRRNELREALSLYRDSLYRLVSGDTEGALVAKGRLEGILRPVMVRTERLAPSDERDGMLSDEGDASCPPTAGEVRGYLELQRLARLLNQHDTIEYWKSAPYLLSFMDDHYDLKRTFTRLLDMPSQRAALAQIISSSATLTLPYEEVSLYQRVDPSNARLRYLERTMLDQGSWRLLWMPPALPYYRAAGPFGDPALAKLTKRLVFSTWRVVPKVVATMLSYQAEREMITSSEENADYSPEARKRHPRLLRFSRAEGRLTGMPVLAAFYPSLTLARICDPLTFAVGKSSTRPAPSLVEVLDWARTTIKKLLDPVLKRYSTMSGSREDEAWYWAAPLLIDRSQNEIAVRIWLNEWSYGGGSARRISSEEDGDDTSAWAEHLQQARNLVDDKITLGRPPADLLDVLAHMALGGPANAALRSLYRITGGQVPWHDVRKYAAKVAWAFSSLFNVPEVIALLRGQNKAVPYWRQMLEYCTSGNLQAILDEYSHILKDSLGLWGLGPIHIASNITEVIEQTVALRAARLSVDELSANSSEGSLSVTPRNLRIRFAMPFGDQTSDDGEERTRTQSVRESFNSPFWPFVLATTSVGQEGLDFHYFCHAVVHWNLPSNPVDLEQREGRVHRYKGHAVRKNLAKAYGLEGLDGRADADPWEALFDRAREARGNGVDIEPYWVFQTHGGAMIERHVPAAPLSRDAGQHEALKRSLAAYRMVFGQAHQEDLVAYLTSRLGLREVRELATVLRIDLEPPHDEGSTP